MPKTQSRYRNCCYTLNNFKDDDIVKLKSTESFVKYHVFGLETGESGTPHVQGYMELEKQMSLRQLKDIIGTSAHIEPRYGTAVQAASYCKKGNEPKDESFLTDPPDSWNGYEYGTISNPGKRNDLDDLALSIIDGSTTVDEIALTKPSTFHLYGRTMRIIEDIALRKQFRKKMTTCDWLWGPTMVGKSHQAFTTVAGEYDPSTHYIWKYDGDWQDGYTGQPIVIINEFRGQIPFSQMLTLIDKWPETVRRRNREPAPFLAEHVIITSCKPPHETYINMTENLNQLLRRVKVTHITSRFQVVESSRGAGEALAETAQ